MLVRENTTTSIAEPPATAGDTMSVRTKEWLRKQWFFVATIVGVSAGLILGLVLQQIHLSVAQKLWIGEFLNLFSHHCLTKTEKGNVHLSS